MEREPIRISNIIVDRTLYYLTIAGLYALSCTPTTTPISMPESKPTPYTPSVTTFSGAIDLLQAEDSIVSDPEPEFEVKTENDPNIVDVPGLGRFRRTDVVLEGEASTYSRNGCLGCREDRKMRNEEPLDDNKLTLAVPPKGPIPLNSFVLVENITEPGSDEESDIPWAVARATDTGGFEELGRIADLTLTTNHFISGGVRGGTRPLRVRLTLLEPVESIADNS